MFNVKDAIRVCERCLMDDADVNVALGGTVGLRQRVSSRPPEGHRRTPNGPMEPPRRTPGVPQEPSGRLLSEPPEGQRTNPNGPMEPPRRTLNSLSEPQRWNPNEPPEGHRRTSNNELGVRSSTGELVSPRPPPGAPDDKPPAPPPPQEDEEEEFDISDPRHLYLEVRECRTVVQWFVLIVASLTMYLIMKRESHPAVLREYLTQEFASGHPPFLSPDVTETVTIAFPCHNLTGVGRTCSYLNMCYHPTWDQMVVLEPSDPDMHPPASRRYATFKASAFRPNVFNYFPIDVPTLVAPMPPSLTRANVTESDIYRHLFRPIYLAMRYHCMEASAITLATTGVIEQRLLFLNVLDSSSHSGEPQGMSTCREKYALLLTGTSGLSVDLMPWLRLLSKTVIVGKRYENYITCFAKTIVLEEHSPEPLPAGEQATPLLTEGQSEELQPLNVKNFLVHVFCERAIEMASPSARYCHRRVRQPEDTKEYVCSKAEVEKAAKEGSFLILTQKLKVNDFEERRVNDPWKLKVNGSSKDQSETCLNCALKGKRAFHRPSSWRELRMEGEGWRRDTNLGFNASLQFHVQEILRRQAQVTQIALTIRLFSSWHYLLLEDAVSVVPFSVLAPVSYPPAWNQERRSNMERSSVAKPTERPERERILDGETNQTRIPVFDSTSKFNDEWESSFLSSLHPLLPGRVQNLRVSFSSPPSNPHGDLLVTWDDPLNVQHLRFKEIGYDVALAQKGSPEALAVAYVAGGNRFRATRLDLSREHVVLVRAVLDRRRDLQGAVLFTGIPTQST
ncbi:unnamed protein product [Cyprideis torosa]|uniref:Uncharacterized protein n=1 Tax=Cyprideis torosa TaxID=163714 RepID=A0A7R8WAT6_9CRUS|nr:unnamed protein product [Cyprideis torosa]CAG0890039.1 unnamed protein product [Cyprideis torosa]